MLGMSNGMFYGTNGNFNIMDQGKGKGKSREADFEAAFAQITASLQEQTSRIEEVKDDVDGITSNIERTKLDDEKVSESETGFKKYVNTFLGSCENVQLAIFKSLGRATNIRTPTSTRRYGKVGSRVQPTHELAT
jgi:hypothetical protein